MFRDISNEKKKIAQFTKRWEKKKGIFVEIRMKIVYSFLM